MLSIRRRLLLTVLTVLEVFVGGRPGRPASCPSPATGHRAGGLRVRARFRAA